MTEFDFTLPGLSRPESARPKRVAEAIKMELSLLLQQKVRDPRLQSVSISKVAMTPDLKLAKISFEIHDGSDVAAVKKGLEKAKGFFRSVIAKRLNMRYTPQLVFYHDRQLESTERLDAIFAEIAQDRKVEPENGE